MAERLRLAQGYSFFFFLAFALSIVMLITDTNLRTNFGTMKSGYFLHWDVIAATAVADLIGAILLVAVGSRTAIKGGIAGSGLLILIYLGDIATYSLVGFSSAKAFADYLFGITYFGGDIRYLYDVLLAVYILAFLVGIAFLAGTWERPPARSAQAQPPEQTAPASPAGTPPS
jgi:hypothetical protein